MKIAIFGKSYRKNLESSIVTLLRVLDNKQVEVHFDEQFYTTIKAQKKNNFKTIDFRTFNRLDNSFDLLISIGGDGTMLRASTYVRDYSIPIVGINTGRL
jgi:NAD+ kinase